MFGEGSGSAPLWALGENIIQWLLLGQWSDYSLSREPIAALPLPADPTHTTPGL